MNNIVKERILSEARQAAKRPQREAFNEIVAQKSTNTLKKELIDTLLSDIQKEDVATICKRYGWSPSFDKDGNEKPPTQTAMKVAIIKHLIDTSTSKSWKIAKDGDFIYLYNGAFWLSFTKEDIIYFLERFAIKVGVPPIVAADEAFLEKLYKQLQKESYFGDKKEHSNKNLINLQNGTFEIEHLQLRQFDYKDFLTYQLPYSYKEEAVNAKWQRFLDEVLPNKETQRTLQEVLGSIFVRDIKLEYAFFLYGSGQNGKSVVMEVITSLLGKENVSNFSLEQLMEEHNRALIKDKLLNFGSESDLKKIDIQQFKALASGEPIQARLKYGNSFMMENYAKLIFNVNKLQLSEIEYTKGFFRRFLIIPFNITIPAQRVDKRLHKKIIAAGGEGILNWIIEGAKRVIEQEDIFISQECKEAKENFIKEIDSVLQFLEDKSYKKGITSKRYTSRLYNEYKSYCYESGFKPLNVKNFSNRLIALGFDKRRDSQGAYFLFE